MLLLLACRGPGPEADSAGADSAGAPGAPLPADIDVTPSLRFEVAAAPGTSLPLGLVVTNVGGEDLAVTEVSLASDAPEGVFVLAAAVPPVLAPGDASPLVVTYRPVDADGDAAELAIGSSDADEPRVVVAFAGNGG